MILKKWEDMPEFMKNNEVKIYYEILSKKKYNLYLKRTFDLVFGIILLIFLIPLYFIVSILIKVDSKGPIFFKQIRVTQYGERFYIYKFRTMIVDAENIGSQITSKNDNRITKIGRYLRKYRIDETPQIINIILGDMSFVGTRPEVPKYVDKYSDEMLATLLLPAGVTSEASINYKNESLLLENCEDIDEIYINKILVEKMEYNLHSIRKFNFFRELKTIMKTVKYIF